MIPAHGYEAVFTNQSGSEYTRPVVAWDNDGWPLLLDGNRLRLMDTWAAGNLRRIQEADTIHTVIPGGGWLAEIHDEETGQKHTAPVIAWTIDQDGYGSPIVFHDQEARPVADIGAVLSHPSQATSPSIDMADARTRCAEALQYTQRMPSEQFDARLSRMLYDLNHVLNGQATVDEVMDDITRRRHKGAPTGEDGPRAGARSL